MERGPVTFAILFLALPLLLFAAAWALPSWSMLFGILGLFVLVTGFTLAVGVMRL